MPAGRPTEYNAEVVAQARAYLQNYATEHKHPFPSVVGLCKVIGRGKSTLYEWAEDETKEFADILATINEYQEMDLLHKGLTGDFNAQITKLVLGKHGYQDQSKMEHAGAVDINAMSDDQLNARIAALLKP